MDGLAALTIDGCSVCCRRDPDVLRDPADRVASPLHEVLLQAGADAVPERVSALSLARHPVVAPVISALAALAVLVIAPVFRLLLPHSVQVRFGCNDAQQVSGQVLKNARGVGRAQNPSG